VADGQPDAEYLKAGRLLSTWTTGFTDLITLLDLFMTGDNLYALFQYALMSVRATNILLSKHFAHTSDFVDDFLFLTDANE
jgi:hypothetical protein